MSPTFSEGGGAHLHLMSPTGGGGAHCIIASFKWRRGSFASYVSHRWGRGPLHDSNGGGAHLRHPHVSPTFSEGGRGSFALSPVFS